jgi:hypothetical protein
MEEKGPKKVKMGPRKLRIHHISMTFWGNDASGGGYCKELKYCSSHVVHPGSRVRYGADAESAGWDSDSLGSRNGCIVLVPS